MNCKPQKSVFESISEIGDVKFDFLLFDEEEWWDNNNNTISVLDILEKYPSSHLSINTLLKIIFSYEKFIINDNCDVYCYARLCNRFFIPKNCLTTSISSIEE